jgi:hypothetical protein
MHFILYIGKEGKESPHVCRLKPTTEFKKIAFASQPPLKTPNDSTRYGCPVKFATAKKTLKISSYFAYFNRLRYDFSNLYVKKAKPNLNLFSLPLLNDYWLHVLHSLRTVEANAYIVVSGSYHTDVAVSNQLTDIGRGQSACFGGDSESVCDRCMFWG